MKELTQLDLKVDGAMLFQAALKPCLSSLELALANISTSDAEVRLHGVHPLGPVLGPNGCIGSVAHSILGKAARPVRAILFNKSPNANWALGWHQDRTICVRERRDVLGFGPWTLKSEMHHVAPPFDLLTRMITLRAHLDDVPANNAPLLIAPGSHALGLIKVDQVADVVRRCGTVACLADAGDIWVYSTPILHASEAAENPAARRGLQVDFAAEALPHGLSWLGV